MFVNKLFTCLMCAYLKKSRCFNVKPSAHYFRMKTKILADFQICFSVPLKSKRRYYFSKTLHLRLLPS